MNKLNYPFIKSVSENTSYLWINICSSFRAFIVLIILFLSVFSLVANPIDRHRAETLANEFFSKQSFQSSFRSQLPLTLVSAPSLIADSSFRSSDNRVLYYIFNRGINNGFVIVSGDDKLPCILGYSSRGRFLIAEDMPSNIKGFFAAYKDAIRLMISHDLSYAKTSHSFRSEEEVDPLLQNIEWNQDYPWNDKCPTFLYGKVKAPVGCVATATSQIMRYWRWPDKGVGSNSYTIEEGILVKREKEISASFDVEYDWDHMPQRFDNPQDASPEVVDALSTLCFHVGVAENMIYGTQVSGTMLQNVVYALRNHFKYDKSVELFSRSVCTQSEWEAKICNELNNKRPVLYAGFGAGGGHAFVCDGYDAGGLFHINWGWGGESNGYFDLNLLNPEVLGIGGGSGGGFNYGQQILINFMPDKKGDSMLAPTLVECRGIRVQRDDESSNLLVMTLMQQNISLETNIRLVAENVDDSKERQVLSDQDVVYEEAAHPLMTSIGKTIVLPIEQSSKRIKFQSPKSKYKLFVESLGEDQSYHRLQKVNGCVDEVIFITDESGMIKEFEPLKDLFPKIEIAPDSVGIELKGYDKSIITFHAKNSGVSELRNETKIRFYDNVTNDLISIYEDSIIYPNDMDDLVVINIDRLAVKPGVSVKITAECVGYTDEIVIAEDVLVLESDNDEPGYIITFDQNQLDEDGYYHLVEGCEEIKGFSLEDISQTFVKRLEGYVVSLEMLSEGIAVANGQIAVFRMPIGWDGKKIELRIPMTSYSHKMINQMKQLLKEYPGSKLRLKVILVDNSGYQVDAFGTMAPLVLLEDAWATGVCGVKNRAFKVYPNPVKDYLYIEGALPEASVIIYDMQGRRMISNTLDSEGNCVINLSTLPSANYLLVVDDKSIQVQKR